jgi:hypothetical protein
LIQNLKNETLKQVHGEKWQRLEGYPCVFQVKLVIPSIPPLEKGELKWRDFIKERQSIPLFFKEGR